MINIRLICVAALMTLSLSACVRGTGENFLNKPSPDPLVYPLSGTPERLTSYHGKKLALIFWSTQCSTSMGQLKSLAKDFATDPKLADVTGIAINIDSQEREDKVTSFIAALPKSHLQFSYSANDIYDEAYRLFDVSVVPQLFAIDPDGVVRAEGLDADIIADHFEK